MSYTEKQSEVNKLLGEKEHLKQEEVALRKVIEAVKKQVSALQVEQLEIKNRVPLSRVSPSFFLGQGVGRPAEEVDQVGEAELNLEVLGQMHSGTFAVEEQEEDSD